MSGYIYRGTVFDAHEPTPTRPTCGTTAGYYAHRRHNEDQCDQCREACKHHARARRAAEKKTAA